jgi:hypothetical protein
LHDRRGCCEEFEGALRGLFYSHGGGGSVRVPLENLFRHLGGK